MKKITICIIAIISIIGTIGCGEYTNDKIASLNTNAEPLETNTSEVVHEKETILEEDLDIGLSSSELYFFNNCMKDYKQVTTNTTTIPEETLVSIKNMNAKVIGTGFIADYIDGKAIVITCRHVVTNAENTEDYLDDEINISNLEITLPNGEVISKEFEIFVNTDNVIDICIIPIECENIKAYNMTKDFYNFDTNKYISYNLKDINNVKKLDLEYEDTSKTYINAFNGFEMFFHYEENIDMENLHGASGSPLFLNTNGEANGVIGILRGGSDKTIGFVSFDYVIRLLNKYSQCK